ncbi:MAG: transglutaminase family protein [Verrucomicrobiaceae bacterium]
MTPPDSPHPSIDDEWHEPLLIQVRHLTRFVYQGPTTDSFNEARLQPVSNHAQECLKFDLRIDPLTAVRDYPDFFGNCVHYFDVTPVHQSLEVEAVSLVQTRADIIDSLPSENPPSGLKDSAIVENYFDFLQDSAFVSLEAEIWREALDVLPGGLTDLWRDSVTIGRHIFKNFIYTPSFTTVNTKLLEVLATRRGVCQDFAHLMLGMCRSMQIPARYVSGYFLNPLRREDEIEASHAWVEVYLPGYGWKGFDPTHNRVPDTRYVKLAVGRDYGDIRPVSGTFRGHGTREMTVEVQVRRGELS